MAEKRLHEEVDCVVDIEDLGGRCSPIVVRVPETRSGLPIQTAHSLLTPVITTGSLVQPPQEELEEDNCDDLKPLPLYSERLPAVHCSIV